MKLLSKFAVGLLLSTLPLFGQINGVPASVTSHGPGRGPAPGVPASVTSIGRGIQGGTVTPVRPSVTSLGPNGFSNTCTNCTNPAFTPTVNFHSGRGEFGKQINPRRPRHHDGDRNFLFVPYAYPYYGYDNGGYDQGYDPNQQQQAADQQQQDDPNRIAPTVFDNGQYMGPMPQQSAARADSAQSAPAAQSAPTGITSAPLPPVDPTVLVFRDGHQQEVRNYAIVGDTLYDIGGQTAKKIKLADLDLARTEQVNDQRGVDFQVPKSAD